MSCNGLAHLQRRPENIAYMSEAIGVNSGKERALCRCRRLVFAHAATKGTRRFAEWFRQTTAPDSRG